MPRLVLLHLLALCPQYLGLNPLLKAGRQASPPRGKAAAAMVWQRAVGRRLRLSQAQWDWVEGRQWESLVWRRRRRYRVVALARGAV